MVIDDLREKLSRIIPPEVTHVYIRVGNRVYDIKSMVVSTHHTIGGNDRDFKTVELCGEILE